MGAGPRRAVGRAVRSGLRRAAAAWSATREGDQSFPAINRFVITPLFLFVGAFYPIDQLPEAVQPIAWVTPPGTASNSAAASRLGTLAVGEGVLHARCCFVFVVAGAAACHRTYSMRLFR